MHSMEKTDEAETKPNGGPCPSLRPGGVRNGGDRKISDEVGCPHGSGVRVVSVVRCGRVTWVKRRMKRWNQLLPGFGELETLTMNIARCGDLR